MSQPAETAAAPVPDPLIVRFRERREELGWSQRELARRAGIRYSYYNQVENGRIVPKIDRVRQIAGVLELTLVARDPLPRV